MFRHIRSKLIAAFAVPLAILVAVAGLGAVSSLGQINSVDRQTALASASVGPGGLVQALQTERFYAVLDEVGAAGNNVAPALQGINPAGGGLYQKAAQITLATDTGLASFRNTVGHSGSQAQTDFAKSFSAISTSLTKARAYWADAAAGKPVSNYQGLEIRTYNIYTNMIGSLINATSLVPLQISDPTLRSGVEALYTSLQKTEVQYRILQDLFVTSWSKGDTEKTAVNQTNIDWGTDQTLGNSLGTLSHSAYHTAITSLQGSPIDSSFQLDLSLLQVQGVQSLITVLGIFTQPAQVAAQNATTDTLTNAQLGDAQIAAVVNARAHTLHNNAVTQAVSFGGVGAIGILLGFGLVILVSRSISRPLVDLARQAERLAQETLPATVQAILDAGTSGAEIPEAPEISVHSRDEVSEMAKALDAVQKTAVQLASGQAALRKSLADAFVNLGRRNQNLVTRQLEYISEIELKEADPESLEELFKLDHLATRMRRNAESLLILAGSGPARQWSASVPAMDVARAASAEVEDYKRLRLHHFDPAQVTGGVTTDLVHIMAELTENALTFSPPGSPVDIYGRFLEGGYVIVIVDSGIGMSADDLEVANRRLEGEGHENDVPGRYLGHFVAGRLARRHGIAISLQASHSGGLVARVKIPANLIEDPVPDLSAVAEVRGAQNAPSVPSAPVPSFDPSDLGSGPVEASIGAPAAATANDTVSVDGFTSPAEVVASAPGPVADFVPADDLSGLEEDYAREDGSALNGTSSDHRATFGDNGSLPEWAGGTNEPSWDDDAEPAQLVADDQYAEAVADSEPEAVAYGEPEAVADSEPEPEAEPEATVPEAEEVHAVEDLEEPVAEVVTEAPHAVDEKTTAAAVTAPAAMAAAIAPEEAPTQVVPVLPVPPVVPTPDLGAGAPLVAGTAPVPVPVAVASWDPTAQAAAAAAGVGPAAQARNTADGLRKLTRRVPGASLPVEDGSLRRATPTTTGRNPLGLTGALSQYLSATTTEGRTEKEQNAR